MLEKAFSYTCILPEEVLTELLKLNIHKSSVLGGIRDRPFNLQRGLWFFASFRKFFSDTTRVRTFFVFPEFNITLYEENSESDYCFFPPPKSEYFFSNIGNQNIFFRK